VSTVGLVVGLGNPILSDDAVGLYITEKLQQLYDREQPRAREGIQWRFLTFDGNPLDLVSCLSGVDVILVIDSHYPHDGDPVSLVRFDRIAVKAASRARTATTSHGFSVIDMLDLAYQLELARVLKAWVLLVPVDDPYELGEGLTAKTRRLAQAVVEYIWGSWFFSAELPEGPTNA